MVFVARTSGSSGSSQQISIPEQICEFCGISDNYLVKVQILECKKSIKPKQKKIKDKQKKK